MKNAKKLLALLLALVMVLGLAACSGNEQPKETEAQSQASEPKGDDIVATEGTKEPVVLEWYYRGNGIQKDTEMVEAEFNKLLQTYPGMEHVTVNFNCYTGADYPNAVALAQSADQQIDILNTVGLDFVDQVKLGTYAPLNDLLADNQALYNELPEWLWDLGSVDGNIYMVPHYQRAANQEYMVIPVEYLQYGDEAAIRALCDNPDRTVEEIGQVIGDFVKAVQANVGTTKYTYSLGQLMTHMHGFVKRNDNISNNFVLFEGSDKVEYMFTSEDAKAAYAISAQWYDEGLIHPDRLTIEETEMYYANMMNPVSYCFSMQNGAGSEELMSSKLSAQYGFDVVAIPIWDNYFISNNWAAGGDGITAKCEHPVEALRLLELMNTDEGIPLYNMIVYGLEGVHYEKIDDTHIKTLEYDGSQGGVDASYAAMKWIMGNTFHAYLNQACNDQDNEIALEINESDSNAKSSIMGFRVDTTSVQTQIEQVNAVNAEYCETVRHGVMGESGWEAMYNEYVSKMENAGLNEVLNEIQRQVDEFLQNK